jgi:hypothetical protein
MHEQQILFEGKAQLNDPGPLKVPMPMNFSFVHTT